MLSGLVVSAAVAAVLVLGPWLARHAARRPRARELRRPAGRVPGRRGARRLLADRARAAGGARRPRRPRPARPRAAPLDRLRARGRAARPARRRARARRRGRHRRAAGAATPARCSAGRFSTGAIKAVGALALAAYAVSGRGREGIDYVADLALLLLATNLFNLLDLRPGRVEKAFVAAARRPLPRRLDRGAARAARDLHRPGAGRWPRSRCASGRCSATPARTWSARSPGSRCWSTLGDAGRWIALALVAALTIFGEFRSISKTIESVPPLRWLDSLGRVSDGRSTKR